MTCLLIRAVFRYQVINKTLVHLKFQGNVLVGEISQYTGRQTTQVKKNVLVLVLEWPKNGGQKCPVLQQMRVRVNTVSVCVCVFKRCGDRSELVLF